MTEVPQQNQPAAPAVGAVERISAVKAQANASQAASRVNPPAASTQDSAAATFADYARVNRDIANVVDSLVPPATAGTGDAESAILSLLPQPSVVLPLPPADPDTVAFVAQVAQAIQRQAALARAAMSGVSPSVVDASMGA